MQVFEAMALPAIPVLAHTKATLFCFKCTDLSTGTNEATAYHNTYFKYCNRALVHLRPNIFPQVVE